MRASPQARSTGRIFLAPQPRVPSFPTTSSLQGPSPRRHTSRRWTLHGCFQWSFSSRSASGFLPATGRVREVPHTWRRHAERCASRLASVRATLMHFAHAPCLCPTSSHRTSTTKRIFCAAQHGHTCRRLSKLEEARTLEDLASHLRPGCEAISAWFYLQIRSSCTATSTTLKSQPQARHHLRAHHQHRSRRGLCKGP